jgi:hypothetical protein
MSEYQYYEFRCIDRPLTAEEQKEIGNYTEIGKTSARTNPNHLTETFLEINAEVIGNDYLIVGTVEKQAWRENINQPKPFNELLNHIHDFKSYQNLHMTMAGWFRDGQDPPVMEPPPSNEWLKGKT